MKMALVTPLTPASGWSAGRLSGFTVASTRPSIPLWAEPISLITSPFSVAEATSSAVTPFDPFTFDFPRRDPLAEGEAGEDRGLERSIAPGDIIGGVGLGVAETLGLGQGVVIAAALFGHRGEDVVGGPVHDAAHHIDVLAGETLGQGANHRDPTSHRCLVHDGYPGPLCRLHDLLAPGGDELLVGGDHGFPRAQGGQDQGTGRLETTDHLDDHVDRRVGDDRHRVVGQPVCLDGEGTLLGQVPHRDTPDLQIDARFESDGVTVAQQPVDQGATDGPGTEHADADGHGLRLDSLCSLM